MIKLIIKYSIGVTAIFTLVTALWFTVVCRWVSSETTGYFSADSEKIISALKGQISPDKAKRHSAAEVLESMSLHPEFDHVKLLDSTEKTVYAATTGKGRSVEDFISVKYPIYEKGEIAGWLKIWIAPGFVFRWLSMGNHLTVLGLCLFLWALTTVLALVFYVYKSYLTPMHKLDVFAEHIEQDEFIPLDVKHGPSGFKRIFGKLNNMNSKMSEATATLHILFQASQALTSRLEINEIFGTVIDIIQRKFPDVGSAVILLGEDGFLRMKAHRGVSPDFVKDMRVRPGEGFVGLAYQKMQIIVVNDCEKEESPVTADIVKREGLKSFLHMPMVQESKCVGVLSINSRVKDFFTKDRIRSFSTLAEYLSIAIRNMELYERVQELNQRLESEVSSTTRELIQTNSRLIQKVREMKALSDISGFAASKTGLADVLELIVEKVKDLLSAQAAGFFMFNPETNELIPHPPFFGIRDREFSRLRFNVNETKVFDALFNDNKNVILNDEKKALEALPLLANILAIRSLVMVPLKSGKKIVGVMGVANKFNSPFDQNDIKILELIADRVTGVIENVKLYQELEHRLHDLTTLQDISSAISSEPIWEQILKKVVASATQSFNADLCAILLSNPKTNELITQPGAYFTGGDEAVLLRIPVDDNNSVSAQVFRSGEAFLSPDASIDPRIKSQTARLWDLRSLILVPLKAENRVIGVLRIGRHQPNCFTKDHLRLATLIAHQAAIIIENAQLYESLREAKSELERLNQVKNEFISIVSHELRTPITAIKGFVKVILQGDTGELNSQQQKFLTIVDQSIDRLTVLISDLLDISRIESGQMNLRLDTVDPRELVKTVVNNLTPGVTEKNVKLTADIPSKLPMITADKERLMQVLDNLILNAVKFTSAGGEIKVAVEDKGDYILFRISDNGIGIAPKEHKKIFEKFYQVDSGPTRSIPGAGLGLAIVKSIVDIHGGQVWVESELGKGSSFMFIIPRTKTEIKDFRKDLLSIEHKKDKKPS